MALAALAVVLLCGGVLKAVSEEVGKVKLSFFFESLDGRLPSGQTCDSWPYVMCDIFLKICVTSEGSRPCDVFSHKSEFWEDTHTKQVSVGFPLRKPLPKSLDVVVEALDADTSGRPDEVARFRGNLQITELPNTPAKFRMVREDLGAVNRVQLESYAHIVCARFYYGGDCSRKCMPDPQRYFCDTNGNKKCNKGYLGKECDQRDYCLNHTCAEFAECRNSPTRFECWCDDMEGPQCFAGFDPCSPERNPCSGHGECSRTGPHGVTFKCLCEPDWMGDRCQQRRPPCLVALENNVTLCLNGGTCHDATDVEGQFSCDCPPGWWGDRCEKTASIVQTAPFIATTSVVAAAILLSLLVFSVTVCWKKKLQKRQPTFTCVSSLQVPHMQSGPSPEGIPPHQLRSRRLELPPSASVASVPSSSRRVSGASNPEACSLSSSCRYPTENSTIQGQQISYL
uniref:Delta-like protein n=1 Tax=Mesocestoides corti TaxID=53468 RepID=A0A5K3FSE7_MESCO